MTAAWVLATDTTLLARAVALARSAGGEVTVVAVGDRSLADVAAAAGPDRVLWADPDGTPAEALAGPVADLVAGQGADLLLAASTPASRALVGVAAARCAAALVAGVVAVRDEGGAVAVERFALDGAVLETVVPAGPLAAIVTGDETPVPDGAPAPVTAVELAPGADLQVTGRAPVGGGSGLRDADRVVSIGRGVRSKTDLELIGALTRALEAELACSMPVADDLGWVPKERYVGRSGQHIAPRLYLAVGIAGMPQHMEGVRGAKVVAAVNSDPAAPIFRTADYGVVGDLYEVVPALVDALTS